MAQSRWQQKLWRKDYWTHANTDTCEGDIKAYQRYDDTEGAIPLPPAGSNHASILSNELWLMIMERLPQSILARTMCALSWRFHSLVSFVLYREIDASLHLYIISEHNCSADFSLAHWDCGLVARRHRAISNALKATTRYALYARSLSWTMGLEKPALTPRADVVTSARTQVTFFALLDNVTRVDLDTGFMRVPPMSTPPSLFPKATKIRLGGVMPYALASAILHGRDKAPLTSLICYNIIEPGRLADGTSYEDSDRTDLDAPDFLHPSNIEEDWPEGGLPIQVRPGCMRRLLTPELQKRCSKLDELLLRRQGQQHSQQELPSEITHDDDVYREWAEFLRATKPRHVRLEHGGSTKSPLSGRGPNVSISEISTFLKEERTPMDQRFHEFIVPVLLEGWERLSSLEIQGVAEEVTRPLSAHYSSKCPKVHLLCDERVDWCWNGIVFDDYSAEERFLRKPPHTTREGRSAHRNMYMKLRPESTGRPGPRFYVSDSEIEDLLSSGSVIVKCIKRVRRRAATTDTFSDTE